MVIISQKAVKHDFIGPLDRNQRKNLRSFTTFMQNKANFRKSQMNVNPYNTMDYENKRDWTLGENKPNSNPIKANFRKVQMNVNSFITKDYRKNDAFAVQKNKPNSNPIQTQSKPILERMNVNFCATGYYESKPAIRVAGKPTFAVREGRPNNPNDARLSGRSLPVSAWPSHDGP